MSFFNELITDVQTFMGNAVKLPRSNDHNSQLTRCQNCQRELGVFKKQRKECWSCHLPFCIDCLVNVPSRGRVCLGSYSRLEAPVTGCIRICNRCRVLTNPNFTYEDLMQLKAKDLVWYLQKTGTSTLGLKEKEQLAEVVLEKFGNDQYQAAQAGRMRRVAELSSNLDGMHSSQSASSDNVHLQPGPSETVEPSQTTSTPQAPPPSYGEVFASSSSPSGSPAAPDQSSEILVLKLDQIKSEDHLESLSIKEVKHLLAANFVDYKGCVERDELFQRLRRLFREHRTNKEDVEEERVSDDDVCKICMDARIDCVLLECGHMVACVQCGKQCSDCPICRQYVVRAVRIFKS